MASKSTRPKVDETRARRPKALEPPREPRRPKTHWDHVIEEMIWLSKDFESERKWKLAQAKKVALKASRGMLDQATKGEKKMKEEEHRLRKVALNISKDVKKFWLKIEKLVLYKHRLELENKKKKALDKQLEYLLGQTERYSNMLAENLVDPNKSSQNIEQKYICAESSGRQDSDSKEHDDLYTENLFNNPEVEVDEDYTVKSEDELDDDERTIEKDEALITEQERRDELIALRNEMDLPLEELVKRYAIDKESKDNGPGQGEDADQLIVEKVHCEAIEYTYSNPQFEGNGFCHIPDRRSDDSECNLSDSEAGVSGSSQDMPKEADFGTTPLNFNEEQEDDDFVLGTGEEKDDEATLSEEEEFAKAESISHLDEIAMLQEESELPIEELLARYGKGLKSNVCAENGLENASPSFECSSPSNEISESPEHNLLVDEDDKPVNLSSEEEAKHNKESAEGRENENRIADAAAAARSAQPTGNTFSTTTVRTKFPFLLKFSLREYQHIGLDWLVTMYENRLNGILADEMGLGKTIMTIALLAHLACEKGIWGPHLIVVPTSVMLNWETEFLKWCPAFKILTYFGSAKERKCKRQGWMKPNSFHICITTYRLVIQDAKVFKRKKWKYLILDEAHLIKNWKSQRWQTLLNFNSKRRILLTGTPLQNDLMELWSLMHFLMPHIFQSHQEFKDWFSNPISGMVDGQEKVNKEVIDRLHNVLRPFILRRLKRDVEKQLPSKHEHVIYCRLSRRQRNLYEDFIASSETQATLANGNFFGMISVIMQLRKVCNHPDLFEGRPIISSYDMVGIDLHLSSLVCSIFSTDPLSTVDLRDLGFVFTDHDYIMNSWETDEMQAITTPPDLIEDRVSLTGLVELGPRKKQGTNIFEKIREAVLEERSKEAKKRAASIAWWNSLRCRRKPIYSTSLRTLVTVKHPVFNIHDQKLNPLSYSYSTKLAEIVLSPVEWFQKMINLVESFMFAIPAARAPPPVCWFSRVGAAVFFHPIYKEKLSQNLLPLLSPIRPAIVRRQVYFPDRRLIQFDCGKLQELAVLLRRLKTEGHRALIFTQMTKMLDVLEAFINLYGYTYMRLDGSTQPEERQTLMQRFNTNPKIFLFILSTRSGGVGINLVGADTVIFYDSDWNPAMDQQAQDRCHRIGQTREVHIYRLISESTIEENILKKAKQKRALDDLVIQSGEYNTEFFKKLDPIELFSGHKTLSINGTKDKSKNVSAEISLSNADVEAALKHVEDEADYKALKKVEEEEAVENLEFTEEAIVKMEEDEFVNEDDNRVDEVAHQGASDLASKDCGIARCNSNPTTNGSSSHMGSGILLLESDPTEEKALTLTNKEGDVDLLADVEQMAVAAAASGQSIASFENHLRPIDRYAIRYLEVWDPIVDKAAMEHLNNYEERDWELDRIEKFKEDMEAEIDDEEEPLVYEQWDADFATKAYRQQVEALAQHQLMEELENKAREREKANEENHNSIRNEVSTDVKPKSKKKIKKAKFKSLKKGHLASESKVNYNEDPMMTDDETIDHGLLTCTKRPSAYSDPQKKRKKVEIEVDTEEEMSTGKKFKKDKKRVSENSLNIGLDSDSLSLKSKKPKLSDDLSVSIQKFSISTMHSKRVLLIKPEKVKKKGTVWSGDSLLAPDVWQPQEDAVLCAVVHEYGTHWSLVSDTLYGMVAGGFYRGRYRHPVHCCERYRELIQKHILTAGDGTGYEKISGSGKAVLKVTEENVRMLLNIVTQIADQELLLQKHFTALLTSVWKVKSRVEKLLSAQNHIDNGRGPHASSMTVVKSSKRSPHEKLNIGDSLQSRKLIAAALNETDNRRHDMTVSLPKWMENGPVIAENLELTIEFHSVEELDPSFPPAVSVIINGSNSDSASTSTSSSKSSENSQLQKFAGPRSEDRFRMACRANIEDAAGLVLSVFPTSDHKSRQASKATGKHKLPVPDTARPSKPSKVKRTMEHSQLHQQFVEPTFHPISLSSVPRDPQSEQISPVAPDFSASDLLSGFSCGFDEDLAPIETDLLLPHQYLPEFTSGLDDFPLSSEVIDIG
uniref:DNA helicase n=1 Tax=Kalanchoe fedtschenkoi TaxID=63787 RepID=A0A7N1A0R7_KALFE